MGITKVVRLENRGAQTIRLLNLENPNTEGHGVDVAPGGSFAVSMFVPWASAGDFPNKHLQVEVAGATRFWIWQAAHDDGDFVRFSRDGAFHPTGEHAHGVAIASAAVPPLTEDRTIQVFDGWFELFGPPLLPPLHSVLGTAVRLAAVQPSHDPVLSVPKASAVAWSVAGVPSDARDRGQPNARFLYRDSGKRWEFALRNGVVVAIRPDRTELPLTRAISYDLRRVGDRFPAPSFDLIAASGGRVFAKEQGRANFYFAILDAAFLTGDGAGGEVEIPSNYFKLDPEFNQPGANPRHKSAHLVGDFFDHPAAERFPLFRHLMETDVTDFMVVKVERNVWHKLDTRTPLGLFVPTLLAAEALAFAILGAAGGFAAWADLAQQTNAKVDSIRSFALAIRQLIFNARPDAMGPPPGTPTRPEVTYVGVDGTPPSVSLPGVDFVRVLDIGVGHVHAHQQYETGYGGELQPLKTGARLIWPFDFVTAAWGYRFFNGPLRDGDGFIDGTANFYALVELHSSPVSYALLLADEQSYFSQRWRLADPEDHEGLSFALVKDLHDNPQLYGWDKNRWWSPFRSPQRIEANSRLAVAGQVVLMTGKHPLGAAETVIFSTNFSFSTMDRTWRWRRLPAPAATFRSAAERIAETIALPSDGAANAYPETLRLREDLTIHMKGTKGGIGGRYVQRYLPFDHQLVPAIDAVAAGQPPAASFEHRWDFLPEATYRAADFFSHFGVYDVVDSRTQFYEVTPETQADADALTAGAASAWIDDTGQLTLHAWKFWWGAPTRVPNFELNLSNQPLEPHKKPPSIFNPDTRLRILRRGSRFIATFFDKRDDELMPFETPAFGALKATLKNGTLRARVSFGPNVWMEDAPGVAEARFVWPLFDTAPILVVLARPRGIFRVRLAAFDPAPDGTRAPAVTHLLDIPYEGNFASVGGARVFSWQPTAALRTQLRRFCTPTGRQTYGTSLWVEDLVGRVAVPDDLLFETPIAATATPSELPLDVATTVTVHAQDLFSNSGVSAAVLIDGVIAGPTDAALARIFKSRFVTETDPESHETSTVEVFPIVTVQPERHGAVGVVVDFYHPTLTVSVTPTSIRLGQPTAVTVRSVDARSGSPIAGRVVIGGIDVGATNAPFTYTFTALGTTGGVTAAGFPTAAVRFPLTLGTLRVTVEPNGLPIGIATSLVVRAVDAASGAPVAGRVLLAGSDVAATNVPFNYTFGPTAPAGVVRATFFADAGIPWPTLYTPRLTVAIAPYPVVFAAARSYVVSAREVLDNHPVDGEVKVDGAVVGRTNSPFTHTFVLKRVRVFDADLGKWIYKDVPPQVKVSATGYPQTEVDLGYEAT